MMVTDLVGDVLAVVRSSMLLDWALLVTLMLTSIPLSWWIVLQRPLSRRLAMVFLFLVYTPLSLAAPFLDQPRSTESTLRPFGICLMASGIFLSALALLELRRNRGPVLPVEWAPVRLVQTGVYRYIRHPMSTAQIALHLGWYCAWAGIYTLVFIAPIFILVIWLRAYLEERCLLLPRFGKVFHDYQAGTGMLLPVIPWLARRHTT